MNEKIKEKVDMGFFAAILIILFVGLMAGIMGGYALRVPTEDALEAIADLSDTSSFEYRYEHNTTYKIAQQKEWSGIGTLTMIGIWFASALAAFLLYVKKLQLMMTDTICYTVQNIENKLNSLALYRIAEKKTENSAQDEANDSNT